VIRSACLTLLMMLSLVPVALGAPAPPTSADSTAMDWSQAPEYRIVPGDMLMLNFGREASGEDRTKPSRVRPDGRISVFPIGDVVAAGRSPRELEAALVDLLAAEFKAPRVTVEVTEVAGNQVHVIGRVKVPGSIPVGPFTTVIEAITKAGGFEDDAARNSVIVFHRDGARTVKVMRLKVDRDLKRGRLEADMPLSRFDIVYVPRSTIGNINVFSRQFFGEQLQVMNFALVGWELFNLDRVFVVRTSN
jgi:protein involved in polysaccharide export with SLBB domain